MGSNLQFDLSTFKRRQWLMIAGGALIIIAAVIVLILLLGGGGDQPDEPAADATVSVTSSPTASLTPQPTPVGPPTETATPAPTATLEPYQYTVQEGETLYYILQLFGYRDLVVIPELLALNNMADENDIRADQVLLIPRQTPTPGPTSTIVPTTEAGEVATTEAGTPLTTTDTEYVGCSPEDRCISADGQYWMHEVVEGDTCAYLAVAYDTTVPDILQDNNLTDSCFIVPGEILKVYIRVTLTPTLTPTGGPDSTATPTPTLSPPSLLAPANGASIARNETVVLQWAAVQALPDGAYYLVVVQDASSGDTFEATTRSNIYRLPDDLRPGAGASTQFQWHITIVDGSSTQSPQIGGTGVAWAFIWGD